MKQLLFFIFLFVAHTTMAQTGIGTTTPVNKFEVVTATADPASSGTSANGNLRLGPSSGSHVLDFGLSSTSTFSWLQARSKSAYGTTYNLVLNPIGGNVGIGTTSPTAKLNLVGGGVRIFDGFANNVARPTLNTSTIGNYEIRGVGAGGGSTQADGADDGFLRLSAGGGTNSNTQASIDLTGYSSVADMSSNIVLRTAGSERLRIDNAGNVGIGNSAPVSTLTVGNATGTIPGEITLNPTTTQFEGAQLVFKRSLVGSTVDWIMDQYGTTSSDARLRIFAGSSEANGLIIKENGFIGIGNSAPTVRLQVSGDIIANSIAGSSDARFKTNVSAISNPLQKVLQLRGVTFDWKTKEFPARSFSENHSLGFIAQEVEKVLPEIVQTENTPEGYKSVQYDKVVALLVEAIKEQQKQIDSLTLQVKKLKKKNK